MTRLPGRAVKAFGCSSQRHQLWLTPEYLLHREITGYRESVKRYYYADIQAIVSGPTRHWFWCNVIAGGMFVAFSAVALYAYMGNVPGGVVALPAICATVFLCLLAGNLLLGPTCRTTLYTATSEARLYSLGRQRATRRALNRLVPFIDGVQGREMPAADSPRD